MSALERLVLGAPGVYTLPPEPIRQLTGVSLDACAFVGVAPRGPCRVPRVDNTAEFSDDWRMCKPLRTRRRSQAVAVESFDEYRRLYGGFEGPGLLPYAVSAFFEQGGRRAYIVRIVHHYGYAASDAGGVAQGILSGAKGSVVLWARDEGEWGNRLEAVIGFRVRPLRVTVISTQELEVEPATALCSGALLRLRLKDGSLECAFVAKVEDRGASDSARMRRVLRLEKAATVDIGSAEIVEGTLEIDDAAGNRERFEALGLDVAHPRWLGTVLCRESRLVWPDFSWAGGRIEPADPWLISAQAPSGQFSGGLNRYAEIIHDDFFDAAWTPGSDEPFSGVQCLDGISDLAQIVVPDLYQPEPLPSQSDVRNISLAGPEFADCVEAADGFTVEKNVSDLPGLARTPTDAGDLDVIIELQQKLQEFAEISRDYIVLLDVPPGLKPRQVTEWRSHFDSAYCAAYHPWLVVARDDTSRRGLVNVPPSAVAAGIIAAREIAYGIPHGPANEIARQVVKPLVFVTPKEHDFLHPLSINVYLQEPLGVRLTAARTLSLDRSWRQLSVRRLMLMLRRTLLREMQWVVFEPNTPSLRRELTRMISSFLRRLYRLGAFTGATEDQAYFVRCDEDLNPAYRVDNGQLLAQVGVAPSEPLEYIVLQFFRSGDGTLTLED
jgi:hypothetical protein